VRLLAFVNLLVTTCKLCTAYHQYHTMRFSYTICTFAWQCRIATATHLLFLWFPETEVAFKHSGTCSAITASSYAKQSIEQLAKQTQSEHARNHVACTCLQLARHSSHACAIMKIVGWRRPAECTQRKRLHQNLPGAAVGPISGTSGADRDRPPRAAERRFVLAHAAVA